MLKMFRQKKQMYKGKPVQSGLPSWVILLGLILCCGVLLIFADYMMKVNEASVGYNATSLGESPISSAVVAQSSLSESEQLHEEFRQRFAQLIGSRLLSKNTKSPSDYDATKMLSDLYKEKGVGVNFVQVGACDGEWVSSNDPIQKLMMQSEHWFGVMLEPVPQLYEKLRGNVAKAGALRDRTHLMNAALSDRNGAQDFYIVNDKFAQEKPGETHALKYQIGSFEKTHITKHLVKLYRRGDLKHEVDDYIKTISVKSMTPDKVVESFRESGMAKRDGSIDVLIIDAEGYDLNVLKSFMSIPHLRPPIIVYETLHMTGQQETEAKEVMTQYGYTVWPAGWNALAVRAARVEPDN